MYFSALSWTYCCKSDNWANMWQVTVSGGRATRTLAGRRSQCSLPTWAFPRNACTLHGWDLCSQTPDQPGPTGLFLRTLSLAQEETPVKTSLPSSSGFVSLARDSPQAPICTSRLRQEAIHWVYHVRQLIGLHWTLTVTSERWGCIRTN